MRTIEVSGVELYLPESARAVVANAYLLAGAVAEETAESERLHRLSPRMEKLLRASGVFQMGFRADRGGLEMPLAQQFEVVAAIARIDAGIAWNVGVLNATGYYAGRLSEDAAAVLYPDPDHPTSGSFHPAGRADKVEGGYLVSGRWGWGSGSYTAEYVLGGCEVFDGGEVVLGSNGKQAVLGVWLPKDSVVVEDDWHSLGVRASGSSTYHISEPVFVEEQYTFNRLADMNADANPLNKSVNVAFFSLGGVAMGIAQHAVDLAHAALAKKKAVGAPVDQISELALGEVIAEVDHLYAGILATARRTDEVLFTQAAVLTPLQEARMGATKAQAAAVLKRIMPLCAELVGAQSVFDSHPFQRLVRDTTTAVAHAGAKRSMAANVAANALRNPELPVLLVDDERLAHTPVPQLADARVTVDA